jgi:hypothetical protein
MTDNDDVARELIGSAGLPPDMPRMLSGDEAEYAIRWRQALVAQVVNGHLHVREDSDDVCDDVTGQVREVDAIARNYIFRGADRTVRPGEEIITEPMSHPNRST